MGTAFDLCALAWGEREGYVFLSQRNPDLRGEIGYWRDIPYKWPHDRERIEAALEKATRIQGKDTYWSPAVYDGSRRDKKLAQPTNVLWADLDEADPQALDNGLKPAAAWQTSPGRFQAVWLMPYELPILQQQAINKELTYKVGADKGGWDATQVLRLPGTRNLKYPNVRVKPLWLEERQLEPNVLLTLATSQAQTPIEAVGSMGEIPDFREVLKKYKLPARAKSLLKAREGNATPGHRSERLWELECLLAEAGMKVEEIIAVARASVWNKFAGRHDELSRLFSEAVKATDHTLHRNPNRLTVDHSDRGNPERLTVADDTFEEADVSQKPLSWDRFDRDHKPIRWLIADVWGESEVGFISGMPKAYKSWLALDMAVSVPTGTPFLGSFASRANNVLLIQEEDPRAVLQDRLVKIAAGKGYIWARARARQRLEMLYNLPDNLFIISNSGFSLTNEEHLDNLKEWLTELKIGLVILDPLMMMAEGVDEFKAFEMMSTVFKPLKKLRAETQASICVVHHHTKNAQASGGQAMYGSVALWAWEEAALHLTLASPGRVVAERFSKHSNLSPLTIEIGDTEVGWSPTVFAGSGSDKNELIDLISTYENGITLDELTTITGLGRDAVRRQLNPLIEANRVKTFKGPTVPGHKGRRPTMWKVVD